MSRLQSSATKPHFRFGKDDLLTIGDYRYICHSADSSTVILSRCDNTVIKEAFSQVKIAEMLASGELVRTPKHFNADRMRTARQSPDLTAFSCLPPNEQDELILYERLIQGVMHLRDKGDASLSEESLRQITPGLWAGLTADHIVARRAGIKARKSALVPSCPAPRTLLRWIRRYRDSGRDILSLRDGRKGRSGKKGPRTSDPSVAALLDEFVRGYMDERRPSMKSLYLKFLGALEEKCAERGSQGLERLLVPSLSTFERAVKRLDGFLVLASREGEQAARRKHGLAGKSREVLRAGERVITDSFRLTLFALPVPPTAWSRMSTSERRTAGPKRPVLCIMMDGASRFVLSATLSSTASGADSVRALSLVCADKTAIAADAGCQSSWEERASIECVSGDGGSENKQSGFRASVADLGAEAEIGPASTPEVRAVLERFFHTVDLGLTQHFSGRTFENLQAKGDYPALERASLTTDEVYKAIIRWIVDVYHHTPHEGLAGLTPAQAWSQAVEKYGVLPPPDPETQRAIFGYSITRKISNRGIRFAGLHYASADLARLVRKAGLCEVLVRVNLDDLGAVAVREDRADAAWFTVPCSVAGFDMVSIEKWQAATTAIRRRHADTSKLTESIVRAALKDLADLGDMAAKRAGIASTTRTPDQLRLMERALFGQFNVIPSRGFDALADDIHDEPVVPAEIPAVPAAEIVSPPQMIGASPTFEQHLVTLRERGFADDFFQD
ncbi:MAG: Transposase-like Mu [Proteobacteria bacterium]|nr:Transposase-like Mu [Pseudomonadota bacterium]